MDDFGNEIMGFYPDVIKHFVMCSDEEFNSIFDYLTEDYYAPCN